MGRTQESGQFRIESGAVGHASCLPDLLPHFRRIAAPWQAECIPLAVLLSGPKPVGAWRPAEFAVKNGVHVLGTGEPGIRAHGREMSSDPHVLDTMGGRDVTIVAVGEPVASSGSTKMGNVGLENSH